MKPLLKFTNPFKKSAPIVPSIFNIDIEDEEPELTVPADVVFTATPKDVEIIILKEENQKLNEALNKSYKVRDSLFEDVHTLQSMHSNPFDDKLTKQFIDTLQAINAELITQKNITEKIASYLAFPKEVFKLENKPENSEINSRKEWTVQTCRDFTNPIPLQSLLNNLEQEKWTIFYLLTNSSDIVFIVAYK